MNAIMQKIVQIKYVLILYFMVLIAYGSWIYLNNAPLSWDQSGYMTVTAQLGWAIKKLDFWQVIHIFLHHDVWGNRPALFMLVGGFIFNIAGSSVKLIVFLSNTFWLGILTYSTFKLSMLFSRSQKVAFIAVFIVLTSPGISILSRDYTVDLPLTAALTLFYYRLFCTDYFKKNLIGFVASFIFLALIKESFALYIVPLICMMFIYLLIGNIENKKIRLKHLLTSCAVSIIIISIFYYPIFEAAYANIIANVGESLGKYYSRGIEKTDINYYLYYVWLLCSSSGVSFIYIFLIFIVIVLNKQEKLFDSDTKLNTLFLLLTLFSSILCLTFITDVNFRFAVPIIPLLVISFLAMVNDVRCFFKVLIVTIGVIQLIGQLYSFNLLHYNVSIKNLQIWNVPVSYNYSGQRIGRPLEYFNNVVPEIVNNFADDGYIHTKKVFIVANSTYFNANILQSYLNLNNLVPYILNGDVNINVRELMTYDIIIIKTDKITTGCPFCVEESYQKIVNDVYAASASGWVHLAKSYDLTDGSKALVYVKTNKN